MNTKKGFATGALISLIALGSLGAGYTLHKIDQRISERVDEAVLAKSEAIKIQIDGIQKYLYEQTSSNLNLGAAVEPAGLFTYRLGGGGISSSATSFTLTSLTLPQNDYAIQDSDLSDTFYITIEPGNTSRQEFISCTTIGSNSGGTVTISGCTRGLAPITPYTASSTLQFAHSGGAAVIFSAPPGLFNQYAAKGNDETITGAWGTTSYPTASTSLATQGYVLDAISGTSTLSYNKVVVQATAGETITQGQIVYFDTIQDEWMLADASATASSSGVLLGIAQGAGTNGNTISNGVLLKGLDTTNTGGTQGNVLYLSDTAGATSTSAGTFEKQIAIVRNSSGIYFDPTYLDSASFFTRLVSTNSTSTNATTTSFSTTNIAINGVNYQWPTSQTASSTFLSTNGSGSLSWNYPSLLIADGTTRSTTQAATTTVYTHTIPAGFLGATQGFKIEALGVATSPDSGEFYGWDIQFGDGTSSTTIAVFTSNGWSSVTAAVKLEATIYNNSSASSQITYGSGHYGTIFVGTPEQMASSSAPTVNTANQSYISFRARSEGVEANGFRGITIWKLGQ